MNSIRGTTGPLRYRELIRAKENGQNHHARLVGSAQWLDEKAQVWLFRITPLRVRKRLETYQAGG